MESLDRETVRKTLDVRLMVLQIIHGAQAGSVVLFGGVVLFTLMRAEPPETGPSTLKMLSIVHGLAAVSCAVAGTVMFNILSSRKKLEAAVAGISEGKEDCLFGAVQTAYIVRSSVFEGAALLGLVVCFVGATTGELITEPVYRLNAVSPVLYLLYAVVAFPTRERVGRVIGNAMGMGSLY